MVTRTKKIFVGGLSANTVVEDVKQYFEQFGKVSSCLSERCILWILPFFPFLFKVFWKNRSAVRPALKGEPHFLLCSLIFFEAYLSLFCGSYCLLHLNVYSIIQHCQHCSGLKKKIKTTTTKITGSWICVCSGGTRPLPERLHSCLLHNVSLLWALIPAAEGGTEVCERACKVVKCL